MSGVGFGVWGGRGVCCALLLSFTTSARAQSTAAFPTAPAPASPAPAPVPSGAPDPTTASRYPELPSALRAAPTPAALPFYPALLPYLSGQPVPAGYRVETRPAKGLIIGGLASLVLAYGAAIAVGAGDGFANATGWLVLPVVGPWAAIGARKYHCDNDVTHANACVTGAFNEVQTIAILSADAVVQATGAVLFLAGLGSGYAELVRSDVRVGVRITPRAVGANGLGVGLVGRF
jgi:hypothetical protein